MKWLGTKDKVFPDVVMNPFNKDSIESISVYMRKPIFSRDKGYEFDGHVYFKSGNTKGEQKFTGSDFKDLFAQMELFIQSLK